MHALRVLGSTIVLTGLMACSDAARVEVATEPTAPAAPAAAVTVIVNEDAQSAMVGRAFSYTLAESRLRFSDPTGAGLTYSIALTPAGTGLSVSGTAITGVPSVATVIMATVIATDVNRKSAEARFPIIAQSTELHEPRLPVASYAYADETAPLPPAIANSPQVVRIDNMSAVNRVTDAGAALGRVLFYDRRLSVNDQVSCASCHQQQFSFSDTARLSIGVLGTPTRRHSMPLTNVRFYGPARFFRDERAATLEDLALQPVFEPTEMGLPPDVLVPKLQMARYYAPLFAAAFGDSTISTDRTAKALSQFVRALKTTNSKIDSLLAGTVTFSSQEYEGQTLFEAVGCRSCHESYAVVSDSARNNGLDATNLDNGAGQGRLKSPSLRNVVHRPPYMHDGRFRTLEEVIDFYDAGVQDNPDLDRRLRAQDGSPRRLHLSASQKRSLVAFLHTLTDRAFLIDPRFGDPFAR